MILQTPYISWSTRFRLTRKDYGDALPITIEVFQMYGQYLVKIDAVFLASKLFQYVLQKACENLGHPKDPAKNIFNLRIAALKEEKAQALLCHPIHGQESAEEAKSLVGRCYFSNDTILY